MRIRSTVTRAHGVSQHCCYEPKYSNIENEFKVNKIQK